eukprot:Awhi_evm2s11199
MTFLFLPFKFVTAGCQTSAISTAGYCSSSEHVVSCSGTDGKTDVRCELCTSGYFDSCDGECE